MICSVVQTGRHQWAPTLKAASAPTITLCDCFPLIRADLKEASVFHFLSSLSCHSLCFPPSPLRSCHSVQCLPQPTRPFAMVFLHGPEETPDSPLVRSTFVFFSFPVLGCRALKGHAQLIEHWPRSAQVSPVLSTVCV